MSDITTGPGITGGGDDPTTLPARQDADQLTRMMELAVTQGEQGVAALERLVAMKREQDAIEARRQWMQDFNRAQAELPAVLKTAYNDQTRSKYATLADMHARLRPVYTAHGFGMIHGEADSPLEGCIRIEVEVTHRSGHSETRHVDVPLDATGIKGQVNKTQTHAKGSTLSYAIRYADVLIWAPEFVERDRDGQTAAAEPVTAEQALALEAACEEVGGVLDPEHQSRKVAAIKRRLLAWAGVDEWADFPAHKFDAGMALVKGMLEGRS